MPYWVVLLLPFPLWPNQVLYVVGLIFFLEINFILWTFFPQMSVCVIFFNLQIILFGFSYTIRIIK